MDIKNINIEEGEVLEIKISKDINVKIHKVDKKSTFVKINHHHTSPANTVELKGYVDYKKSGGVSWSNCESEFYASNGTSLTVEHTAFNK